ncbi:MAG: hypothetical protein WC480_03005 [Patescibacteria group bacterium]
MINYQDRQRQLIGRIKSDSDLKYNQATIIAMEPNKVAYNNSQEITLTLVVFVPASLGQVIQEKIILPLQKIEPEHFYSPLKSLHLTIKNVRAASRPPTFTAEEVKKVDELFKKIVPNLLSFDFTLEGLMPFATSASLMGYCDERLKDLVIGLDAGLRQIGVPDNKKYFSNEIFFGNISLCRFVHEPSLAFMNKVEAMARISVGNLPIKQISLITCNKVCSQESQKIIGTYNLK